MARFVYSRIVDDVERAAWWSVLKRVEPYPSDKFMPPFRAPLKEDFPRSFLVAVAEEGPETEGEHYGVSVLHLVDGANVRSVTLSDDDGRAREFAHVFFTHGTRGHLICWWGASRFLFHWFLRYLAPGLVDEGYDIRPLAAGTSLKAIIVRKGRQSWTLCDIQEMTGLTDYSMEDFVNAFPPIGADPGSNLFRLWGAVASFQRLTLDLFGVQLSPTIGRAALRAASRHVPDDAWKWRPEPMMVALCRAGGAYRGGYAFAQRYVGPAYKMDANKAYTWALGEALPLRSAFGKCVLNDVERPGIYMCRVRGPGKLPIYIAPFVGEPRGFEFAYWNGDECLAVVPSSEFPGLRALGYQVIPGHGLVFTSTFTLSGYVDAIAEIVNNHERGTPAVAVAKRFGVSVYGKFAEKPERIQVAYRAERPGKDWHPFLTIHGDEVPNLWVNKVISHRSHQQIDLAAVITARVRSLLYQAMATVIGAGGAVVHADTDGFLSSVDPLGLFETDGRRIGSWRLVEQAEHTVVVGRKAYSFGPEVRYAGVSGATVELVEIVARGDQVTVHGQQLAPPWETGPMHVAVPRTLRVTA